MANKRQLKKAIRYSCGEIVGECFFAASTLENTNPADWDQIVIDAALMQEEAIKRVSVEFDKTPKSFANGKEYKKARRSFFKAAEKSIADYLHEETEKIAKAMNELVPKGKKA